MLGIVNGEVTESLRAEDWRARGHLYEVIRVTDGIPLFLEEHLLRMEKGSPALDRVLATDSIRRLIGEVEPGISQNIFVSLDMERGDLAVFFVDSFYPPAQWYEQGVDIDVLQVKRVNPNLKVYDADYKKLVSDHLKATGFFETLISDDGLIKEGSRSNVFFIGEGTLWTPPVLDVLPGITRDKVLEIAGEMNFEVIEQPVEAASIGGFTGAFITGTSIDLLPVRSIGGQLYDTVSDPLYRELLLAYGRKKEEDRIRYEEA